MSARRAVIAGIGRTSYSRNSGRTTLGMANAAARMALDDAGLKPSEVDGVATFATPGDSARTLQIAHALGLDSTAFNLDLSGGGQLAAMVVAQTMLAIESGACDVAIVYRSLNSRSGKRFGRFDGIVEAEGIQQFSAPHGYMVPGQWFAMWARRHMHEYGTTAEDLGRIAVQQRRHATANEHALFREPLTLEQYLDSRWINEPFRVYDCAAEADGATALVLTTEERARDLKQTPIRSLGHVAHMGAGGYPDQWSDMTRMYSATVGPKLWERTGVKPSDMDVACLYDCFTYTALCTTEDYGFCGKGEGGAFYAAGGGSYDSGGPVINPHGGLLSEGYIHGFNHHYEAVMQLRGQAGHRQVPNAELALVSAGGICYGSAMVYAKG
jgi:acetyl-CoA acetyltransferase